MNMMIHLCTFIILTSVLKQHAGTLVQCFSAF